MNDRPDPVAVATERALIEGDVVIINDQKSPWDGTVCTVAAIYGAMVQLTREGRPATQVYADQLERLF